MGKGRKNMSDIDYSEKDFEKYIVNLLVAKSGYIQGNNNDYNPQKALLPQTFISFIKETQPDNWTCLCDKFDSEKEAEEKLIEELLTSRKNQGTLDLFRKGFVFRSIQFDTVYWKPENTLNPETINLYKKKYFYSCKSVNRGCRKVCSYFNSRYCTVYKWYSSNYCRIKI